MSWNKVPIKTICKGIYDGPHATPPESSSGAVFLGIPNFINGQLDLSNIRYISEQDLPKWTKRVTPQPNDIVFSYEATLNLYAIIPKGFWGCLGRRMALIRVDEKKADYKFLYYHFYSTAWRSVIQEHTVTGATVDRIPLVSFPDFLVELPDLPTQRRIASILSAYDDLIENNRRQIKLLEEAAQRLYREWFVELRFPGYEDVKVIDGVPEGWKKVTIADSLAFHIGGGWGKETTNGKNTVAGKVIRGTDINDIKNGDFGSIPLRYHTENDILKRVLHPNDIVFELSNGNINNIGRCLMIDNTLLKNLGCNTICASFCKLLRPHDEMISHLLYWEIQDMQNSGRMLPLKKHGSNGINNFDFDGFLKHEYLLPLEKRFVQPLIYIMQKISNIQSQLVFLQEARDRLLSKLMSGEMEV